MFSSKIVMYHLVNYIIEKLAGCSLVPEPNKCQVPEFEKAYRLLILTSFKIIENDSKQELRSI